jgi:hypothetical protein
MFFDAEGEYVFLQLRFGDQHPDLSSPGTDPARFDLYVLRGQRPGNGLLRRRRVRGWRPCRGM